jgi:hypothetical protein
MTTKKKSLESSDIETRRVVGRRDVARLGGVVAGTAAALGLLGATGCCFGGLNQAVGSGCSDRDPTDGLGRGTHCTPTGCTDSDPNDSVNAGRNCGGGTTGGARSCSDRDPNDSAGRGTHC